jgi:hypothetical protein
MSNIKKRSKEQELSIARDMGGKAQPASGALKGSEGDVLCSDAGFLVEAKFTDKKSYSLKYDTIAKIKKEALRQGENWLLQVDIYAGTRSPQRIACLDYEVFLAMIRRLNDLENEADARRGS